MTIKDIKKSTLVIIAATIVAFTGAVNYANTQGRITEECRDIVYAMKALKMANKFTPKQMTNFGKMAVNLCDELDDAAKAVKDTDRTKVLDHIINARGILVELRDMGIPVDKYATQIKTVETMWATVM